MSEYREIIIISAIATALLSASFVAGIVFEHAIIAGLLAALALCFVLLVGLLSLLASDEEQRRAQGLQSAQASSRSTDQGHNAALQPTLFSRAKEFCLPMARAYGLVLFILFAVTAFAFLGDSLVDAGLADWFEYKYKTEQVHPLLQWFWLSLSQALRALDILDMIEAGAGDLHMEQVRNVFAPIEGDERASSGLFGGILIIAFRIAIGVLLVTQAVNAFTRRRRMIRAVEALANPEICENAKRILKLSGRLAIGPLSHAWKQPGRQGDRQWRIQALEVCRDLGDKASRFEEKVQALLNGDRAARADTAADDELLQSAVRALAAISSKPEEVAASICVLWERCVQLGDTRRLSWKGALGLAARQCAERICEDGAGKRQQVIADIDSGNESEMSAWLVWQLRAPDREAPRWPLIIMRELASVPEVIAASEIDQLAPQDLRRDPLEESGLDDIRVSFNDIIDSYATQTGLDRLIRLPLPGTEPLTFNLIPAGACWRGNLGAKGDGDTNERPRHAVILRHPFYLQDSCITIRQFERFIECAGREALGDELSELWDDLRRRDAAERHPMPYVSWTNARAFCNWLMRQHFDEIRQTLGAVGGRAIATLPTECEWEWAARGPAVWTYPWGNEVDPDRLQFFEKPFDVEVPATAEIRHFESGRSWCGLYDMSGNLFDWCDDQLQDYRNFDADAFTSDPIGVTAKPERVQKGGAWCFTDWDARSSYRYPIDDEDLEGNDCGMRVALVLGRPGAL